MAVSEQPRQFTPSETEEILRRASKLEQQTSVRRAAQTLSLAELQQIAQDAGIDPEAVQRAVAELESERERGVLSTLMGAPGERTLLRTLPRPITPDQFEAVVDLIRKRFRDAGRVDIVGRTLTWTSALGDSAAQTQVVLTPRGEGMELRIHARMGRRDRAIFAAGWGVGGMASLPLVAVLANSAAPPLAILGSFFGCGVLGLTGARSVFRRLARRRTEEQEVLVDELAALAR